MKKNLIVARYQENIDWIFNNRDKFNDIFVFNKGSPLDDNSGIGEISRPNIGREAQTYL